MLEIVLIYLCVGCVFCIPIFWWEIFQFKSVGEFKANRAGYHVILFRLCLMIVLWPWLVPFWFYENK